MPLHPVKAHVVKTYSAEQVEALFRQFVQDQLNVDSVHIMVPIKGGEKIITKFKVVVEGTEWGEDGIIPRSTIQEIFRDEEGAEPEEDS